jgi:hypothetical protein
MRIETRHRFRPGWIETRWTVEPRRRASGRWSVDVLFPSTGAATFTAVLRDGTRERLGERRLGDVRWLYVASEDTGYVVVPLGTPAARLRLVQPEPQDSAPNPGPTLAVALLVEKPLRRLHLAVRLAPASAAEAARVAARLQRR